MDVSADEPGRDAPVSKHRCGSASGLDADCGAEFPNGLFLAAVLCRAVCAVPVSADLPGKGYK